MITLFAIDTGAVGADNTARALTDDPNGQERRLMHNRSIATSPSDIFPPTFAAGIVVDSTGCWLWSRGRTKAGYGRFRKQYTHRYAWSIVHGPIPDGLLICHTCDVPACCNPAHLFLGTPRDNMRDRDRKGRHGHAVKPERFPRGSAIGHSKLTENRVIEARTLHATGRWSYGALGRRYGVSAAAVRYAILRVQWKHVP